MTIQGGNTLFTWSINFDTHILTRCVFNTLTVIQRVTYLVDMHSLSAGYLSSPLHSTVENIDASDTHIANMSQMVWVLVSGGICMSECQHTAPQGSLSSAMLWAHKQIDKIQVFSGFSWWHLVQCNPLKSRCLLKHVNLKVLVCVLHQHAQQQTVWRQS